jgi:hypothetical protein
MHRFISIPIYFVRKGTFSLLLLILAYLASHFFSLLIFPFSCIFLNRLENIFDIDPRPLAAPPLNRTNIGRQAARRPPIQTERIGLFEKIIVMAFFEEAHGNFQNLT